MEQYKIHEDNIDRLEKKLTRIQNKCNQLGCEFIYNRVGEEFVTVKPGNGLSYQIRYIIIEAQGIALINDWQFIATIEHHEPMNIIRRFNMDVSIPESYYTSKPTCEHCNTLRSRKDTYLVHNVVTGEVKQVGKSCLTDFTRGLSAEAVASYISYFDELIQGEAPGAGFKMYYDPKDIVATAVEYVRVFGYTKSQVQYGEDYCGKVTPSTACRVANFIHEDTEAMKEAIDYSINPENPEAIAKSQIIIDWVMSKSEDYGYITNLKAAVSLSGCEYRHFGLIVSSVAAYNREMEKVQKQAAEIANKPETSWVGEIGDRITVPQASINCLTGWETQFGYTYLYKIVDPAGHIFTWKTGKFIDTDSCVLTVSLKGTIKAHNEFRGDKQTELTRCKII